VQTRTNYTGGGRATHLRWKISPRQATRMRGSLTGVIAEGALKLDSKSYGGKYGGFRDFHDSGIVVSYSLELDSSFLLCLISLLCIQPELLLLYFFLVHWPIDWEHGAYLRLVNFFSLSLLISFLSSRAVVVMVVAHGFSGFNISFNFMFVCYFFSPSKICGEVVPTCSWIRWIWGH